MYESEVKFLLFLEAGRDVVGGDQVTATNYAQVGQLHGNLLIGLQQPGDSFYFIIFFLNS